MTSTDHVRQPAQEGRAAGGHGGQGWMMITCCIPVLVIAVVLVATGAASVGFLLVALMCTAMMVMRGMNRGDRNRTPASHEVGR